MVEIDEIELKPLKDGGVYKVRFKSAPRPSLCGEWMKILNRAVVGRNIDFVPELPQYFEIVGEEEEN